MQLLIAHRDRLARRALERVAANAGPLELIESGDGLETLEVLLATDSPAVAVVDWDLPGLDGLELCRLVRAYHKVGPPYIVLLAHDGCDIAAALDAGASDCVRTPANAAELRARIDAGRRFAGLPWEKLAHAASVARECDSDEGIALSALCSVDGDDGDDVVPDDIFELESVLVPE
jgi:DNA-binding response OmpR family regulator